MTHDGSEPLVRHVENAVRRPTNMRDDDGHFLWLIGKRTARSRRTRSTSLFAPPRFRGGRVAMRSNSGALKKKRVAS